MTRIIRDLGRPQGPDSPEKQRFDAALQERRRQQAIEEAQRDEELLAARRKHDEQYGEGTYDNRFAAENAYPELRGADGFGGARLAAQRQLERQGLTARLASEHNARMVQLRGGPAPQAAAPSPPPQAPAQPPAAPPAAGVPNEYPDDPAYQAKRQEAEAIRDPEERAFVMRTAGKAAFDRKVRRETGHPDAAAANYAGVPDHIKRKQWIAQMGIRYRNELANGTITWDQLLSESPYQHTGKGPSDARLVMDANQGAQRHINVSRAREQDAVARHMGVSRGTIMAMEDVKEAFRNGKPAEAYAIMAMYGMDKFPDTGMAALAAEAKAKAEQKPEQPNPIQVAEKAHADIAKMPAGPSRLSQIQFFHQTANGGAQADKKAVAAAVRNHWQPYAREMASKGLDNLTADERIEFQQATGGMDFQDWAKWTGLGDTPQSRDFYQKLTGANPRTYWEWVNPFDGK